MYKTRIKDGQAVPPLAEYMKGYKKLFKLDIIIIIIIILYLQLALYIYSLVFFHNFYIFTNSFFPFRRSSRLAPSNLLSSLL